MFLSTASSTRHSSKSTSLTYGSPSTKTLTGALDPAVPPFSYLICSMKLFRIVEASWDSSGVNGLEPDYIESA